MFYLTISLCFHALLCGPGPSASHPWTIHKHPEMVLCMFLQLASWIRRSLRKDIKKEKENLLFVDHQIGMGLNNNLIQALSSCPVPPCVFSVIRKYATWAALSFHNTNSSIQNTLQFIRNVGPCHATHTDGLDSRLRITSYSDSPGLTTDTTETFAFWNKSRDKIEWTLLSHYQLLGEATNSRPVFIHLLPPHSDYLKANHTFHFISVLSIIVLKLVKIFVLVFP